MILKHSSVKFTQNYQGSSFLPLRAVEFVYAHVNCRATSGKFGLVQRIVQQVARTIFGRKILCAGMLSLERDKIKIRILEFLGR